MAFVFLALAEYAVILGIRYGGKKIKIRNEGRENEEAIKQRCRAIDYWALKLFIGLDIVAVGIYLSCVYA